MEKLVCDYCHSSIDKGDGYNVLLRYYIGGSETLHFCDNDCLSEYCHTRL